MDRFYDKAGMHLQPRVNSWLWIYWFVCSLGLIGFMYGISRQLQLGALVINQATSYNQWALPWIFPGKPQELVFVAGVWLALFFYYIGLYLLSCNLATFTGSLNSNLTKQQGLMFGVLLVGINALILAWFRAKNNVVISFTSLVLLLIWVCLVALPFVAVKDSTQRSMAMLPSSLLHQINDLAKSRRWFIAVACLLFLTCLHFVTVFLPFIQGDIKIINEYLDAPEYTRLGETLVLNTQYINAHRLAGLNKYDPRQDKGKTPPPRPGMYVDIQKTDALEAFIKDHNTAYYYDEGLHALVVNRGMTSEEYAEIASLHPGDGDKLARLFQTSRREHLNLMKRDYSPTEMEFFKKNRFEMHNQILNRWVIHHHNFVLGPISEYVSGKPINEINAQYGPLNVVIMAKLLDWSGGISYANYFRVWYLFWIGYFALFVMCSFLFFRDLFYVTLVCILAFGFIILIDFQFLSLGPGLNPIRHFFDVPVLAALCTFIRKRKVGSFIAALLFSLLGLLNNIQFGLALAVALGATLVIMVMLDREILSLRTAAICGGSAILLLIAIGLFLSARGSAKNSMLTYYLSGWVGPPLSVNRLVGTMMAVSGGYLCLVYFESLTKDTKYVTMFLLFYSQGLFLYYTWGGTPPHILNIAPILVLCAVGFLKILFDGMGVGSFQKLILSIFIGIALLAVYIPASFAYYSTKQTFDNVFIDHKTYKWPLKTADFESTIDPEPFLDSVSLLKEISPADPGVYIISKYDNFLPFLAEKFSAMPFFDVPWFLITNKEVDLCIQRLIDSKPLYIFVDTDIERSLNGDIVVGKFPVEGNYEEGIGIESRMRVERLNLLKTIFSAIKDGYEPVKKGILLTAYKRKTNSILN